MTGEPRGGLRIPLAEGDRAVRTRHRHVGVVLRVCDEERDAVGDLGVVQARPLEENATAVLWVFVRHEIGVYCRALSVANGGW